jgi:hypothetical protein
MAIDIDSGTALVDATANAASGVNSRFTTMEASIEDALSSFTEITDGGEFKTTSVAAGAIKILLGLEWDPSDGANLTDNSSGISLDFTMPDDADNQDVFARIAAMVVSDATGAEEGELSFRGIDGGTANTEWATISGIGLTVATGDFALSAGTMNPRGDTGTGDAAAVGYTSADGLILTGQGSTNDVTLKNDADAIVVRIPTGTTGVTLTGAMTVGGATQLNSTATVGVDDTGYDVKFFGATSGQYLLWDESADELVLTGDSKLSFHDAAGGENIIASADGHLEVNAGTTLDMSAPTVDINGTTTVTIDGGSSGFSIDGGAASNLATSAGALTITSAVAATWSTTAGDLTITAGGGDISFDNENLSTTGTLASGALTVTGAIAGTAFSMSAAGLGFINETANAKMTVGLTINCGAHDNEVLAFKSSDVGHAMTGLAEDDTWGTFKKTEAASGGLAIAGYKDADGTNAFAVDIIGYLGEAASTTHTATGYGIVHVNAWVTNDGTNVQNPATDANLFAVAQGNDTRFIVDADGDLFADGSAATVYDDLDDVALLSAFDRTMSQGGAKGFIAAAWEETLAENEQTLIDLDILGGPRVGVPEEERGLINYTGLARLHNSAIRQVYTQLVETMKRLALAEGKLALLQA